MAAGAAVGKGEGRERREASHQEGGEEGQEDLGRLAQDLAQLPGRQERLADRGPLHQVRQRSCPQTCFQEVEHARLDLLELRVAHDRRRVVDQAPTRRRVIHRVVRRATAIHRGQHAAPLRRLIVPLPLLLGLKLLLQRAPEVDQALELIAVGDLPILRLLYAAQVLLLLSPMAR